MTYHRLDWTKERPNILSSEVVARIKAAFEAGLVFGYHSFYCGGRSLDLWVFKTFQAFTDYIQSRSKPGDLFTLWSVPDLKKKNLHLFGGRFPDVDHQADLIVPPAHLDRVKAYLEVVDPHTPYRRPYRMNEVLVLYSSEKDNILRIEGVGLTYDDDWEDFLSELRSFSHPGSEVHIFAVDTIDNKEHILVQEKYPNESGEVPIGGAY
ncbi:hypothetical protein SBV1_2560024 [Verrucomicrobia bacterium]|nr:hypothetical protein SBV1_2560024 [Verrucomicrobiota bacterium]